MKNYILTLVIFFLQTSVALPQIDTWTQITGDGFGFPSQTTVPEMEVFNGYLYASTSPTDPGLATLWRTATGDSGSWSAITNYTPSLNADGSIHTFGTTSLGGGYMWFGTGNGKVGTIIYQSQDGENWTAISKRGFGNKLLTGAAPHMVVFKASNDSSYLYAGAGSHGEGTAGQVWRTYYTNTDSTKWELLIDFASIDTGVQTITYFYVWNNTLYFGTDNGGQLWQSTDGKIFTQNTFVGDGFGDNTNTVLSSFVVFQDTFYVTTTNMKGGQLWRSGNGVNWDSVTTDAFTKGKEVNELRSLRTSHGKLWLTGYTNTNFSAGTPVWRSDDGWNFDQSNIDGFEDSNNNGENAVTIGFGDYQYCGGPNYVDGAQIWRADMSNTGIKINKKDNCSILVAPNPFSEYTIIYLRSNCSDVNKIDIFDITGKLVKSIDDITNQQILIEKGPLTKGLYFYSLKGENQVLNGKFIVK